MEIIAGAVVVVIMQAVLEVIEVKVIVILVLVLVPTVGFVAIAVVTAAEEETILRFRMCR